MSTPAFKDWRVIVEALGNGAQCLILRKGGLAEGREGFQVKHPRFWLFPTLYHEQLAKTKPEAAVFSSVPERTEAVDFRYVASVIEARWITNWQWIEALASLHLWRPEIIQERFVYDDTPGLHVLFLRVYRTDAPLWCPMEKAFQGCKSWIEVPLDFPRELEPVLSEEKFNEVRAHVHDAWGAA